MTKKTNITGYSLGRVLGIAACLCMVACMACSKPDDIPIPIPPPTPPPTPPSGVIQTFTLNDTLIAYNATTTIKWLVTGTNNLTVVTLDGTKVANYGAFGTEKMKANTTYTLEVNNGKKATVSLRVADTITSRLYNDGKRLKQIKTELFIRRAGDTAYNWVDTAMTQTVTDQRTNFYLDNTSKIILITPGPFPFQANPGKFAVIQNVSVPAITWQGKIYTINALDNKTLIMQYDGLQPNGTKILTRDTYVFE